ncbi:metal cation symporter ZIP14-like isoform X2 [Littorina saxatilis]|uniref:Zinc transporter ZIP14 n=1 Tax=Littorina saxatilis TaxID=31220 RepID=A0AAN9G7U0_9CAEN
MAATNWLYVASLLCVFLAHHSTLAQDGAAEAEPITENEASNQKAAAASQNEAADDKLCLAGSAIDTSRRLIKRFENNEHVTEADIRRMLGTINAGLYHHGGERFEKVCAQNSTVELEISGQTVNCSEILPQCRSLEAIYAGQTDGEGVNSSQLAVTLQEAVFSLSNPRCLVPHGLHGGRKPTMAQAWGYGIGFVTLVCIISNIGGLLTPFMTKTFFQRLLQFLVSMGAGTLAATGLLVLIPEAFDIVSMEEIGTDYIWKSATALFSIYVFYISERFLKFFLKSKELKRLKRDNSMSVSTPSDSDKEFMSPLGNGDKEHGHSHFVDPNPVKGRRRGPVATVAWMVLIGDVIHNFVDGMAIGAAFTENVYLGVSIGIAVLCEELPHELGDVAILLHSGMSMKRALFLNFLSACVCYVGLVLGIVLGENTEANRWILALAGGLFLYVPLVDMLPEMSQHLDMKMRETQQKQGQDKTVSREVWLILSCQSLGLLVGICIILLVVNFSGQIQLAG